MDWKQFNEKLSKVLPEANYSSGEKTSCVKYKLFNLFDVCDD
jgi:hypothetical protein